MKQELLRIVLGSSVAAVVLFLGVELGSAQPGASGGNCNFLESPDEFLLAQAKVRGQVNARSAQYKFIGAPRPSAIQGPTTPRRNFIDDEIFGRMVREGATPAPLSGDEEFLRRVHLDLTGRLPDSRVIREFLANRSPDKRDRMIDDLIASDAFTDKWTMWMGDWLRNSANSSTSGSPQGLAGRNAFYKYIRKVVAADYSLREMTYVILSAWGNNYDDQTGAANFLSSTVTPGGPVQDTYDTMLVKSATAFLGLSHYDCLLCHNGRGRLDQLSLWGSGVRREDAQKMAAFFARTNLIRWSPPRGTPIEIARQDPYFNSYVLEEVRVDRGYQLNTTFGNRPNRTAEARAARLTPEYRGTGAAPQGENWRDWFASMLVDDPMFARNIVNRVWKQMFTMALAEPVDGLDPARLDPSHPPEQPWTFQATHPELLERLANEFKAQGYSLRKLVKLIATTSAYQLSSQYNDEWKIDYVPLFARRYARRLDGEEVHDAIVSATGVLPRYPQFDSPAPVSYAMQLMDTSEPRSNRSAILFMEAFVRGNRDTVPRSQNASVPQAMALMNDLFVISRLKVNASPVLQSIARTDSSAAMVNELFLRFISRHPTNYERDRALELVNAATTPAERNRAIEDLAWALVNKIEFVFSY
jgi:hypothetical protein